MEEMEAKGKQHHRHQMLLDLVARKEIKEIKGRRVKSEPQVRMVQLALLVLRAHKVQLAPREVLVGGGGSPGATGATGATGPASSQGVAGLTGSKGETGTAGSLGTTGVKGETGTVGATGPSNVYKGTFSFPDISGSEGTSQIATLSGFKAGKSYLISIAIVTYQPTRNMDNSFPMGLAVTSNLGSATIWFAYQSASGISYRSGAASDRFEYVTMVQITLDGSSSVDFSINLQLSIGFDTTIHLARSDATYVATLVGSIGTL